LVVLAEQTGGRRARDDVAGPLTAHDRQHNAGDKGPSGRGRFRGATIAAWHSTPPVSVTTAPSSGTRRRTPGGHRRDEDVASLDVLAAAVVVHDARPPLRDARARSATSQLALASVRFARFCNLQAHRGEQRTDDRAHAGWQLGISWRVIVAETKW
jgi:hypothetical protein